MTGLPPGCVPWDYSTHPDRPRLLTGRVEQFLRDVRMRGLLTASIASDTRVTHGHFFSGLTPPGIDYYAGHYRGEPLLCLKSYTVGVRGDPSVGFQPSIVLENMARVGRAIDAGVTDLDRVHGDSSVTDQDRLLRTVRFACAIFELFLRIHPYADGNGHMARVIMIVLLDRYGYRPGRWPIEPRPANPPYGNLIVRYRRGDRVPLEDYMLARISSPLSDPRALSP